MKAHRGAAPAVFLLEGDSPVRIVVEPGDAPAASSAVEAQWQHLTRAIPRLFNGPILSVVEVAPGLIRCRRETYQRLIVQPEIDTGVWQLSVTGVVTGDDDAGRLRVLLGQRSEHTRMYPGLWELAPAGGLDPPPGRDAGEIDQSGLLAQLAREGLEEAGLDLTACAARAVAIVQDPEAHSCDVALRVHFAGLPAADARSWEYLRVSWVAVDELTVFLRQHDVIPPTRALLESLSFISQGVFRHPV